MTERGTAISFRNTSLGYQGEAEPVLRDISLHIEAGEFVVLIGPNGSGKSTMLKTLQGLIRPHSGTVTLKGADSSTILGPGVGQPERPVGVAHIHQDPSRGTVAEFTVLENIRLAALPTYPRPWLRYAGLCDSKWCAEQARGVSLDGHLHTPASSLSQGQRHLLALQLALIRKPSVLLADEHTSALDVANTEECLRTTERLCAERGVTVLMVTHDPTIALRYGNRLLILGNRRLAADLGAAEKAALTPAQLLALTGWGGAT